MEQDEAKIVTVYSAIVITFTCPYCNAPVEIKSEVPPKEDFRATCPHCGRDSLVKLNRRTAYRKSVSLPISYSLSDIYDPNDKKAKRGTMIDISKGGLRIEAPLFRFSDAYEKEGALMTLLFSLPPREQVIRIKAKVIRIIPCPGGKFHMAMQFVDINEHQSKAVNFFLMP
ncbi:MAG: PilZ domain-containing protein [Alphaproteobacteria bacterium]|uniref:PilZ domain-containing protein n=1 Tax=Candidatus Nitrobium versatile TaxID=2884831 RepID=A0A953LZB2_9BACT|nr:PilZ domain-containing protein [Candidatus Nitrobium versatile]